MRSSGPEMRGGRALRSLSLLSLAAIGTQVLTFLLAMVVTRKLGPADYGSLNFVRTLSTYFAMPANLGLTTLAIRELSRDRQSMALHETAALRAWVSVAMAVLMIALSPVLVGSVLERWLMVVFAVSVGLMGFEIDWAFQAAERLKPVSLARLWGTFLYCVLGAAAVTSTRSVLLLAVTMLVPHLVMIFSNWSLVSTVGFARPNLALPSRKLIYERMRRAAPLGFSIIMIQLYYNFDTVMLGVLSTRAEVGYYSAAYRVVTFLSNFGGLYVASTFPMYSKLHASEPGRVSIIASRAFHAAFVLAVPLGVGGSILANDLMTFAFGSGFRSSGAPFGLLVWSSAIIWLSVHFGNTLLACDGERVYMWGVASGAVTNVVLNLILIPRFYSVGAAAATVAAELVVMVWMVVAFDRRIIGKFEVDWWRLARVVMSSIMMGAAIVLSRPLGLWTQITLAIVTYALLVRVLRLVPRADFDLLLDTVGTSRRHAR